MIKSADSVLAAVSGGVDSVVLLDVLDRYVRPRGIRVAVAHLNHRLRGESALRDAAFVRQVAEDRGLGFYEGEADVTGYQKRFGLSLEEAARQLRYRFLTKIAAFHGFTRIATGHHLDDNAEVVLMRLIRGSGLAGLSGIPPVREGVVIRPLIELRRSEIAAYAAQRGLGHVEDETNADETFLRNRVRRHLLPLLCDGYNPDMAGTLARISTVFREEDRFLDTIAEKALQKAVVSASDGTLTLNPMRLWRQEVALQRRMIRLAMTRLRGHARGMGWIHIELVRQLVEESVSGSCRTRTLHLPGRIRAQVDASDLTFSVSPAALRARSALPQPEPYSHRIEAAGTIPVPEIDVRLRFTILSADALGDPKAHSREKGFLDWDLIGFPMEIRMVSWEDRFCPLGMAGTQQVKKFLADRKVAPALRHRWPVLVFKDKIVWVPGHRIDNAFRLTPKTRKVLTVELFLA